MSGQVAPPGTPRLLRAHNERAVLQHLRATGPTSRPGLARIAGLSKPTVSQALANLEAAGLVRPVGPASPSMGRTAMLYEADPTAGYVLGVDIGRAWIRVAAADLSGAIVARRDERNRARGAAALVKAVGEVAHDVVAAAGITWRKVAHTVVGGPGVFDPDSDRLRHAPNLPGWSRPGVMSSLREALPPTVTLDNDANLAAVGERTYGSGRDARTFVYVSVGTGIGMGVIIAGELYRGAHGAAGEVGYLPLGAEDEPARGRDAKRRGILEEAASADAVVRTAKRLGMKGATSAKRVFSAARAGDELALAAVEAEADRLALVVGTVAAIVDPEFVLLGGGIGSNIDLLHAPLERRLAELTPLAPPVAEGELGQDAIVLGAVASALDTARDLVFEQRAGLAASLAT
ncbi:MAG TPA: ROK family transcriptional regulator [Thermoleophilaceae bacterium]